MFGLGAATRIYLAAGATDMRKSFDGLVGVVEAAQARGDFEVLAERGRRVLRVHLGGDPLAALQRLQYA